MQEIIIASKNTGKVREFQELFKNFPCKIISLSDLPPVNEPEETEQTFLGNATLKAQYYAKHYHKPCLADDSGIAVDALAGAPGVYSARYAGPKASDLDNIQLLLANMQGIANRACQFICALALVNAQGELLFTAQGECQGSLLTEPQGTNGFGYDPDFYSLDLNKSLATANASEKNSISHRARALQKLVKDLENYYALSSSQ